MIDHKDACIMISDRLHLPQYLRIETTSWLGIILPQTLICILCAPEHSVLFWHTCIFDERSYAFWWDDYDDTLLHTIID